MSNLAVAVAITGGFLGMAATASALPCTAESSTFSNGAWNQPNMDFTGRLATHPAITMSWNHGEHQEGYTGKPTEFDATGTTDPAGGPLTFEWDLDGNGDFETNTGTVGRTSKTYASPFSGWKVALRVTSAESGKACFLLMYVAVYPQPPEGDPGVSIEDAADYVKSPNVRLFLVWPEGATQVKVSNDGLFRSSKTFDVKETIPWTLKSSGAERLPKTVYIRFIGETVDSTKSRFTDDVILDETPPRLDRADLQRTSPTSGVLTTTGFDALAGIAKVEVRKNRRKRGKLYRYRESISVRVPAGGAWVRLLDWAGNGSGWVRIA